MLLTNDELIREFYDTHQDICGKYSIFKVKDIIASPFQYFKKEIAAGRFRVFSFKKIGKFKYNSQYLFTYVYHSKKLCEQGKLSKQDYLKIFYQYEKQLKEHLSLCNRKFKIQDLLLE